MGLLEAVGVPGRSSGLTVCAKSAQGQDASPFGGLSNAGSLGRAVAAQWKPLLLLCAAFALIRSWEEIFFIGSVLPFPATEFDNNWVYFATKGVVFLTCALALPLLGVRSVPKGGYVVAFAAFLVAAACKTAMLLMPQQAAQLAVVAALAGGIGVALSMLAWFGLCDRVNPTLAIVCYLAVRVFGVVPIVFFCSLPGYGPAVAGTLIPALALWATYAGLGFLPAVQSAIRFQAGNPSSYGSMISLVVIFALAFALREPLLGNSFFASGSYTALGSIAISAVILCGIALAGNRLNLGVAFRIVLPLVMVGFLLLPTDVFLTKALSDLCSSAAGTGVEALTVLVLANFCYRYGLSSARLFGLMYGLYFLAICAGRYAWTLFELLGVGDAGVTASSNVVAVAAIALTMVLLPDRKTFEEWGLELSGGLGASGGPRTTEERRILAACHDFARAHALTLREEEILVLVARGKTNGEIQQELSVGKETVRTHRRNLYAKCGVHSRDELLRAVGLVLDEAG